MCKDNWEYFVIVMLEYLLGTKQVSGRDNLNHISINLIILCLTSDTHNFLYKICHIMT